MRLTNRIRTDILKMVTLATLALIGIICVFALDLFASLNAAVVFIFGYIVLAGLVYFYTGEEKGPLGLRGKYAKPFGLAAVIASIGIMVGFLVYFNVGASEWDIWGQIPISVAGFGLGILFGMAAFLKLYRREN